MVSSQCARNNERSIFNSPVFFFHCRRMAHVGTFRNYSSNNKLWIISAGAQSEASQLYNLSIWHLSACCKHKVDFLAYFDA